MLVSQKESWDIEMGEAVVETRGRCRNVSITISFSANIKTGVIIISY